MKEETDSAKIRIVDKRRFTDSGEVRGSGTEEKEESQKRDIFRETSKPQQSDQEKSDTLDDQHKTDLPGNEEKETKSKYAELPQLDFTSFIVSLGTQALAMLGEIPNPESGQPMVNFEAARQTIDIIALLQEKTKGNLTLEEAQLTNEMLTSLRLAYVRKIDEKRREGSAQ